MQKFLYFVVGDFVLEFSACIILSRFLRFAVLGAADTSAGEDTRVGCARLVYSAAARRRSRERVQSAQVQEATAHWAVLSPLIRNQMGGVDNPPATLWQVESQIIFCNTKPTRASHTAYRV